VKEFKWNSLKSERLKRVRGASFEDIIGTKLIRIKKHPQKENQKIMLFEYKNYIWAVPCIEDESHVFLKTLYPSRKYTKMHRKGGLK
jgi:hypothetical protein